MAGEKEDKRALRREAAKERHSASQSRASQAARRRRIERMRERQQLIAMLDDFGDGDMDLEFELLDDSDEDPHQYVSADALDETQDVTLDDDDPQGDDDFLDDEFEDED
jgi:hypothetical protein